MKKIGKLVVAAAFVLAVPGTVLAEVVTRTDWIPETVGMGDVWTFKCPAGGTFDLTIQNKEDDPGTSHVDLAFVVKDAEGMSVSAVDDAIACNFTPSCGLCPQALNVACGDGGTFSILVYEYSHCAGSAGGGYDLSLEVSDSANTPLAASKVKLGGGPKIKAPSWHSATSKPVIDDGKLN